MDFNRTDGKDKDFIENCRLLDMDLDRRVGKKIKRDKYKKYNQLDEIQEAIVVYEDNKVIGGGNSQLWSVCGYAGIIVYGKGFEKQVNLWRRLIMGIDDFFVCQKGKLEVIGDKNET